MSDNNEQGARCYKSQQSHSIYKICFCGKFGVGKTEIFKVLSDRRCEENIGFDCFDYKIDGFQARIKVYDTAGLEEHSGSLTKSNYYRGVHVIIMVYDVTDRESFLYLEKDMRFLREKDWIDDATRLVLVRNKVDKPRAQYRVTKEFANSYLQNRRETTFHNLVHSIEMSVKSDDSEEHVKKLFYEDLLEILKGQDPVVKQDDVFNELNRRTSSSRFSDISCCHH